MKRKLTLLLISTSVALTTNAQRYLGLSTGNWSSTSALYLNPANVADSRHKFSIDLFSVNFLADNDFATINAKDLTKKYYSGGTTSFRDIFSFGDQKKFSMILPSVEVRGPGAMVSLGRGQGLALTTRVRGVSQFHDFDQKLFRTITDQSYKNVNGDYAVKADGFNYNVHLWTELGLTYGATLYEEGKHFLKAGITARYLGGVSYINMGAKNLDGAYYDDRDSLRITNTDLNFSSNIVTTADQLSAGVNGGDVADYFFGRKGGAGIGGDVGLVYEFRPDYKATTYDMDGKKNIPDASTNRYKLRLSAAVTDLGSINYKNDNRTAHVTGTGSVNTDSVKEYAGNYTDLRNYFTGQGLDIDSGRGGQRVHMPTALVLGADYHVWKDFYVNATFIGNLADKSAVGSYVYDQISVTPRFDRRAVSVGLPVTYNMTTGKIKAGAGIRVAGFFIGSDDLLALAGSNSQTGLNFYMGAFVPINKRRPRDSDNDLVSNRRDKCKNEKGVWELRGCPIPDKDADGILDTADKCPTVAGARTAFGCPDADMDSVTDASDACPNEAGLVIMNGCPDRDGDGIADKNDVCPDVKGEARYKGCVDTDKDGVADNEDLCPDKAGAAANQGCPDTDNDGVTDNKDRCPAIPGTVANQGCPEVRADVRKRLAFAATAIQFETGKAVIKKTSNKLLDEIVAILNEYVDYDMTIDGHTDNVGNADKNLQLSRDRAAAVKSYFVSKGIGESRIATSGYGATRPVADNKTAKGRAKNRHVDMDLKLRGE